MTAEIVVVFRELLKTDDRAVIYLAWELAVEVKNKVVKHLVLKCIYENLAALVNSHFFNRVRWDLLKALLAASLARKTASIHLVEAVLQWVKWDLENRQENLLYIAHHITWRKIEQEEISKRFKTEPLLRAIMELAGDDKLEQVDRTVRVGNRLELPPLPCTFMPVPIMPSDVLQYPFKHAILLVGLDTKSNFIIQAYHPDKGAWTVKLDVQMPFMCHYSSTFVKKRLYVIGGGNGGGYKYVKCFAYDIPQNQPFEYEDLNVPRSHAGMTSDSAFIYVIGGLDVRGVPTNKAEKLDLNGSFKSPPEWFELPALKWKRWLPGVIVNNMGDIFVIGGYTSSCECFSKARRKWSKMPSLPKRYSNFGMVSALCEKCIYSFRRCDPREVCICNPEKNTMKVIPVGGNVPKEIVALLYCNSKIWALAESRHFYVYLLQQFMWKSTHVKAPQEMTSVFNAMDILQQDIEIRLEE